jgi:hypothetical protein
MTKTVYTYDPETLELTGTYAAQESPNEPGAYIIPTHSTGLKPPKAVEGFAIIFKDRNWTLTADTRGTWYDEELLPHEVTSLNEPIGVNWTRTPQFKKTYVQLRAAEYPPMTDYLDAVVKGDQEAIQAYIDACLAVKAKYPKV